MYRRVHLKSGIGDVFLIWSLTLNSSPSRICPLVADAVREILQTATTEEALAVLRRENLAAAVCNALAERAELRAERYIFGKAKIGVAIVTFKGELLGASKTAKIIGEEVHWTVKSGTE